jgi:chromosome segregation ATPase
VDYTQSSNPGRVRELEIELADARRRLEQEKKVKENFEDLLNALRQDIESHRNERDNLRDEVVPQLRSRVEGLESEAAEFQKLTYEHTRMQQELQAIKSDNATMLNARQMQLDMQTQQNRMNGISENGQPLSGGVSRSMSLKKGGNLTRTNSLKGESRESLADRVKDVEAQRDALHAAMKSLLARQDHQARESEKRIRMLEVERDRALSNNPGRKSYDREVADLRGEINHLRKRADEALEQKWQCEKGLGGIAKDLHRAQQETSSLRTLLQEHDILIPEIQFKEDIDLSTYATSSSLEKAYRELQKTHTVSLARIDELEGNTGSKSLAGAHVRSQDALGDLRRSMADAEARREAAQRQVEEYRAQAESLREAQAGHLSAEQSLATQLRESAARVAELAAQIQEQLDANTTLRDRLAAAIGRGEREQKSSALRITDLQEKLKGLEDDLMAAQQQSEEGIIAHEAEIKDLKESQTQQLRRMKSSIGSPGAGFPRSPISPMFDARSPRLSWTTSGKRMSIGRANKIGFLERRVRELEKALADADDEMEEVVGKMNIAQMEVMELQSARDEAARQTRRLEKAVRDEQALAGKLVK